jgi:hypothetical protein
MKNEKETQRTIRVQEVYDVKHEPQSVLGAIYETRNIIVNGRKLDYSKKEDRETKDKLMDLVEQGVDVSLRFFISRSRENTIHCITAVVKDWKEQPELDMEALFQDETPAEVK